VLQELTVIQQRDKVLLIKRAYEPGQGLWSIPGGLIEIGETVRDAARREVWKETGIDIEVGGIIDVVDNVAYFT